MGCHGRGLEEKTRGAQLYDYYNLSINMDVYRVSACCNEKRYGGLQVNVRNKSELVTRSSVVLVLDFHLPRHTNAGFPHFLACVKAYFWHFDIRNM
jgi:hypothetical protein